MKRLVFCIVLCFIFGGVKAYALDLSAECAYLMTADSMECLYEKNADKRHNIASTTKIMTAITIIEKCNLDDIVTVSANAASQEGSSIYLRAGERIKLYDLLYGMLLNSGNDAACAAAEYAGGSIENFCAIMNENAKRIGAKNTSFKNPSGLDAEDHFSTAKDMAQISAYAMKNEVFSKIVSTKNFQINAGGAICYLKNHNKLLWNYDGCIGVKTGYTKNTGRCLVSAAERNGITLIAVTLGARDDWNDHKKLLDYGFENVEFLYPIKKGDVLKSYTYDDFTLSAVAKDSVRLSAEKNRKNDYRVVVRAVRKPTKDIISGEKIGFAECYKGDIKLCEVDLVADREFTPPEKKQRFFGRIIERIKKILLNL